MASDKRKNERVNIAGDYFYYPDNKKKKINCSLKNLSITGACISSEKKINNNDIIFLHISGAKDIELKSKAIWKMGDEYGIQFLLDTSEEFENISYVINYVKKNPNNSEQSRLGIF